MQEAHGQAADNLSVRPLQNVNRTRNITNRKRRTLSSIYIKREFVKTHVSPTSLSCNVHRNILIMRECMII